MYKCRVFYLDLTFKWIKNNEILIWYKMLHLISFVGMNSPGNHADKHNESIFKRGANFFRFFFYENFVNKIALDLLIKWTSHVFIKEKWRKVGSPRQYWFLTLSNMISWYFSSLWIIWDAVFYLMSKIFGKKSIWKSKQEKKMAPIHNSFTFPQEPLSALLNVEYWILKNFSWNFMYYGKRWLLQTYVLMKKGDTMFKMNLSIVLHLISYF